MQKSTRESPALVGHGDMIHETRGEVKRGRGDRWESVGIVFDLIRDK